MQRVLRPIKHPIFTLHVLTEHLVCEVWCNASADVPCLDLLNEEFEVLYNAYGWLRKDVEDVYEYCKGLSKTGRADIREAFYVNNRIEDLCNGVVAPIELSTLPEVVSKYMKPALSKFYNDLLDLKEVPGDKLDYYNKLITANKNKTCVCCGLVKTESAQTHYVEDNDHFFPKSHYPFAVVNFDNLVPICDKCNKKHKGAKRPLDHNGKVYYPFCKTHEDIEVTVKLINSEDLDYGQLRNADIELNFSGDKEKNSTWNWLFNIDTMYKDEICELSFTELRTLKNRMLLNKDVNTGNLYQQVIDFEIKVYEADMYIDRKFLKATFLKAIKQQPDWMAVYH